MSDGIRLHPTKGFEAGGVYFRCRDCKIDGVIRQTAPLAMATRRALDRSGVGRLSVATDGKFEPCGVEFSAADCPKCGPNPVQE